MAKFQQIEFLLLLFLSIVNFNWFLIIDLEHNFKNFRNFQVLLSAKNFIV